MAGIEVWAGRPLEWVPLLLLLLLLMMARWMHVRSSAGGRDHLAAIPHL